MMDFLRRLAPPHERDPTWATAVLPSRFASEHPLRMSAAPMRPDSHVNADASLTLDAHTATAPINEPLSQRHAVSSQHRARAELEPLKSELPGNDIEKLASNVQSSAVVDARPAIGVADTNAIREQRVSDSERTGSLDTQPHRLASKRTAERAAQGAVAPRGTAHMAAPLSPAALAQRAQQPPEQSEVIHVSIGRIEVVANTAPAPAVRRTSKPRAGTVTLADYLRGSNGRRR